jgi:hypothetical protein
MEIALPFPAYRFNGAHEGRHVESRSFWELREMLLSPVRRVYVQILPAFSLSSQIAKRASVILG